MARRRSGEQSVAHGYRRVGVVGEQPVDAEPVVELELRRLVAARPQELRAFLVADAEVVCEEAVLRPERKGMHQETNAVGVAYERRRRPEVGASEVVADDAAAIGADA